jgi:hypothetical protein
MRLQDFDNPKSGLECPKFGLPELVYCDERGVVARALEEEHAKDTIMCWERMRHAKYTGFLSSVFSSPSAFFDAALLASSINLAALRIFILMSSGSVSIHLFGVQERSCRFCSQPLDSRHYFGCHFDTPDYLRLIVMARNRHLSELVCFTLNSYFAFLLRSKPVVLTEDEVFLANVSESFAVFQLNVQSGSG